MHILSAYIHRVYAMKNTNVLRHTLQLIDAYTLMINNGPQHHFQSGGCPSPTACALFSRHINQSITVALHRFVVTCY
jgi:hypothetical protein